MCSRCRGEAEKFPQALIFMLIMLVMVMIMMKQMSRTQGKHPCFLKVQCARHSFFTTEYSCQRDYSCTIKLRKPSTILRHGLAHLLVTESSLMGSHMQVTSLESALSLTCF